MPEEDHFSFGNFLGPVYNKFDDIVKMSKQLCIAKFTYLLLYLSFFGFISTFLNHAKYNSHGATL